PTLECSDQVMQGLPHRGTGIILWRPVGGVFGIAQETHNAFAGGEHTGLSHAINATDFSVVLFQPNFMLASEGHLMKVHKNQRLLTILCPPNLSCGATNQGTYDGVWGQMPSQ